MHGKRKETQKDVNTTSQTVASYARKFPRGHWSFLEPGSEKKGYGTDKPDGPWDRMADDVVMNFSESSHPISRASSDFEGNVTKQRRVQEVFIFTFNVSGLQGNLKHLIIWKRWRFLLAFLLMKLRPMHSNGESWCKNTSENSNNNLTTRSYPNYALTLV